MNAIDLVKPKKKRQRKIMWDPNAVATGVGPDRHINTSALMGTYWYPNRPRLMPADPKNIFNPTRQYIDSLEASGLYVAELKWNGDNTLIYTDTDKWWNRHHETLQYQPSPEVKEEMHSTFPKGCIVNAETLNRCTKTIKNRIIVHCLMAWKGQLLLGKSWGDSRRILEDLDFGSNANVILSQTHTSGFWDLFMQAWQAGPEVEGIILKNPKGKLVFSTKMLADVSWMLKIRKPCKKYAA